jgi:hypothetical protein
VSILTGALPLWLSLAAAGSEDPAYPLGRLRLPPMTEAAAPFRLVDLRYSFDDQGSTVSSFETRVRVGASSYLGGEVTGARRGLFFDTQRVELGVTEQNGLYQLETSVRAPRFLVGARAIQRHDAWKLLGDGDLRLSNDLEIVLGYAQDLDRSRYQPPVATLPTTGEPPAPPAARELGAASVGFFYQHGGELEVRGDARLARVRTEASFDIDRTSYRLGSVWNRSPVELETEVTYERTTERLPSEHLSVVLEADARLSSHFVAHASTRQDWEPGVLRFEDEYGLGATFYGRRYRFARSSDAAEDVLAIQRRANALGYNERRVYDVEGLRRFRERLGISRARGDLKDALDDLYRAEVRDRNVAQLGFETRFGSDAIAGVESRSYRAFVGIPYRMALPFSRNEDAVELVTMEMILREDRYSPGILATSRTVFVRLSLNREMELRFRWERPGIPPLELAREESGPSRFTVSYEYAFGR